MWLCARRAIMGSTEKWAVARTTNHNRFFSQSIPYSDGVYEHPDKSPIDITSCYIDGKSRVGGGNAKYMSAWERIFGDKAKSAGVSEETQNELCKKCCRRVI
jgi:hypothetical protein